jgi:hypothetical protein
MRAGTGSRLGETNRTLRAPQINPICVPGHGCGDTGKAMYIGGSARGY